MKRLIRSIVLGSTTAIALVAGPASAHDAEHARPLAPVSARAPMQLARWDRDRDRDGDRIAMRREYGDLEAARARFFRGYHGDVRDRERFERWCAARRVELDRRWAHHRDRY